MVHYKLIKNGDSLHDRPTGNPAVLEKSLVKWDIHSDSDSVQKPDSLLFNYMQSILVYVAGHLFI